jgi:hypothetical protein
MPVIYIILLVLVALLVLLLTMGFFLPAQWMIEDAVLIENTPDQIFPYFHYPHLWLQWFHLFEEEDVTYELLGKKMGPGAGLKWQSAEMKGEMLIKQMVNQQKIELKLIIEDQKFKIRSTIVLDPASPEYTQVAWRMVWDESKKWNPIERFQAFFLRAHFENVVKNSLVKLELLISKTSDSNSTDL